ncbi:MAG: hypothetical protein IKJ17_03940 [Clostridia bacterium]|nr:hypothetical protein [Clostridia bacterium]
MFLFFFLIEHAEIMIIIIILLAFHGICKEYERKSLLPSEFFLRYIKPCANVAWLICEFVFSFIFFDLSVFKAGEDYVTFLHHEVIGHLFYVEAKKNRYAVSKNYPVRDFVNIAYPNDIKMGERIATCVIVALIIMIAIKFVYTYIKDERKNLISSLTDFMLTVLGLEMLIAGDEFLHVFFAYTDIRYFIVTKWVFVILYLPIWWYVSSKLAKRKKAIKT